MKLIFDNAASPIAPSHKSDMNVGEVIDKKTIAVSLPDW